MTHVSSKKSFLWGGVASLLLFLIDQLIKRLTFFYLPLSESSAYSYEWPIFTLWGGLHFSLTHVINHGAAWGLFQQFPNLLQTIRFFLLIGLFLFLWKGNYEKKLSFPLILLITGATSNWLDYFFYGHVIDTFHFVFWNYDFPVFNFADALITTGVFLWLFSFSKPTKR